MRQNKDPASEPAPAKAGDPEIGRFLSADPFVQDATNLQAFNAYSYVQNNPLSLTDPSGFFSLGSIFKAIGHFFRNIGRIFGHILRAIARSSIGRAIVQIIACATTGPFGCAAASAALTLAAGGSIRDALIGAALAFAQTPWGSGPGDFQGIWGVVGNVVKASETGPIGTIVTHAVVGGAVSMAQGGSFETGALTGAVSAGASLLTDSSGVMGKSGDGNPVLAAERTVVAAVAGGTASVLSGGKFANGAITGAFEQIYNGEGCGISDCTKQLPTQERIQSLKAAAWALTPGSDAYDCASSSACSGFGWAASIFGILPGEGKAIGAIGKYGELAVRRVYDIGKKGHIVWDNLDFFPDGLTDEILSEVKNVANIKFTAQLRSFLEWTKDQGIKFHLYTRPSSMLSPELEAAIKAGDIERRYIPGTK